MRPEFKWSRFGSHALWRVRISQNCRGPPETISCPPAWRDQCPSDSPQMFIQSAQQSSKRAKDLVLDFIAIPKTSEKSGMFSVYVREIKNTMDFHIRLLRTNYNSVFQQTSDCRLIFCYETETRVNEANCVYQCLEQKGSQLNFEASSLSGTNWGKLLQLYQYFLKLLSTMLGKPTL